MATPTAKFALEIEDKTSGPANAAANSLESLKKQIDQDTKALREMQRSLKAMTSGSVSNVAAVRKLQEQIKAKKDSVSEASSAFALLGGTFGKTTKKTQAAAGKMKSLTEAMSGQSGVIGTLGGGLSRLGPLLANPATLAVALAAAFLAVAAAAVTLTAALLRFGVAAAGARRDEALAIEGANSLRRMWGRTTASVEEYQAAIDRASDSTNVGRGTLQTYASQLSRTGLRGEALTEAVEAMGIAAQVQGDRGAARFRALAHNALLTGASVSDLAQRYRNELGPIARRQMLSIDNQTARFRRNLDRLFDGLDLEGALGGLDQVLDLFSQNTASGQALKSIMETIFQPMLDAIGSAAPFVTAFIEGMIIAALKLGIAFLTVRNRVRDALGLEGFFEDVDGIEAATTAGIVVMGILATVVLVLAAALAAAAIAWTVFLASMLAVPILIGLVVFGIISAISAIVDWFEETDFGALAQGMIDGLVNGIRNGASRLAQQMRILAAGAERAFRNALGISSPSSLFEGFGGDITAGLSQGIEAGRPGVEDATGGLVDVPEGGGVGGPVSISIGDVRIDGAESGGDPRELAVAFRDELARVLEGVNVELAT